MRISDWSSDVCSSDLVWTLDVASGATREIGLVVDSSQGRPQWSPDGKWLYFTVQARGSVGLYRLPRQGGAAERVGPAPAMRASVSGFAVRSEEHTSELQSLMRISYAVFCLKKKKIYTSKTNA